MKAKIRKSVFETNSSSSHSLVVATKEEKEGFEHGLLWFNVTYNWEGDDCLKDPKTGKKLPAFVSQEVVDRVYEANRVADEEEKNDWLDEELISTRERTEAEWFLGYGNSYEGMEAEEREDGKYNLHIHHFFG